MTLQQILTFKTVMDSGSFSEAALDLDISQASVSQALQDLEASLGVKLFSRGHFGARLTVEGSKLEPYARRILQLRDAMHSEAKLMTGSVTGEIRVASFQSVSRELLPDLMVNLLARYPEIQVNVLESVSDELDAAYLVKEGRAELGFISRDVSESLMCWKLLKGSFLVLVPESYPDTLSLEDLLSKPLVTYDGYERDTSTAGTRYFNELFSSSKAAYKVKETTTIFGLIAKGLGFSILPAYTVNPVPKGIKVLSIELPFEWTIYITSTADSLKIPVVRAFLIALKERFPASDVPDFQLRPLLKIPKS